MKKKVTGKLCNWFKQEITAGTHIIWGNIEDDIYERFPDGTLIHTSEIDTKKYSTSSEGDIITTLNSTYLLGVSMADNLAAA